MDRMRSQRGIEEVHLDRHDSQAVLCFHYDANLVTVAQVTRWATQAGSAVSERYRHESLRVLDMDCGDCATTIEHVLSRDRGILNVSVSYAAERMAVEYDARQTSHAAIVRRVRSLGYRIDEERPPSWFIRQRPLIFSLACGVLLAVAWLGPRLGLFSPTVSIGFYVLAYLTGGYDATRHGVRAALRGKFDIDFLMVIAALGAATLGEWLDGSLLLFLFSLGHALEHFAMGRARNAIKALGQIAPKTARARRNGAERQVHVEDLLRGDTVIVASGQRIPIDGRITQGASAIDQSPVTGESLPVNKSTGDEVFAGTINGDGALEIEVTKLARDTTLARMIELVEEAQLQKSPTQRFTERFGQVFVPVVLAGAVLVIFVPWLLGAWTWHESFLRGMTLLVAASPCALAIATPAAVLSGIGQAARHGVLIKGGMHLENLGAVTAIAFDKTGTLTAGRPEVADVIAADGISKDELIALAAAVESRSNHPLAQAVVRRAEARHLTLVQPDNVRSLTGRGIRATVNGREVLVGSPRFFDDERGDQLADGLVEAVMRLEDQGKTVLVVQSDGCFLGVIALADQPRAEARDTLTALRELGSGRLTMITGDNRRTAARIAQELGIDDVRAELLPEQKVAAVRELAREHRGVAMIGDGVNDAPALAAATVGIAMGASGTDVALETADVALMADDLSKLPFAVALSRQARRIIRQNVFFALAVIVLLVVAVLAGWARMSLAVILHEGSTLAVVVNGLRLLRFRR